MISASHLQEPQQTIRALASGNNGTIVTQAPVQQVLSSAADRWGLLGLLAMIRSADPDAAMLGMGTDLSLAGFDLGAQEYVFRLTSRLLSPCILIPDIVIYTRLSSRRGPTLQQPAPLNPTSMFLQSIMSIPPSQGLIRPPLSVMRHYFSCSIRRQRMYSKKSRRRSCKFCTSLFFDTRLTQPLEAQPKLALP